MLIARAVLAARPTRPRRVATRTIASYPYLSLHEHDLVDDEAEAKMRTAVTISLFDWCVAVAVTEARRWVLVEQHRHGVDATTLEPAGGIIDSGESPETAAVRELREETGFEGRAVESLGWVHPNPALSSNRAHLFLIRDARPLGEPESSPEERTWVQLLDEHEVERGIVDGRVSHALGVLALTRALQRIRA